MLSQEDIKFKWKEIKGGVRNLWGKISDEEIDFTRGNISRLTNLIQDRYGESKENIRGKLDKLLASFDNETDKKGGRTSQSSYLRAPTSSEERNFNSSSTAVGGGKDFQRETYDPRKDSDYRQDESVLH